jgi:hypothetical protein
MNIRIECARCGEKFKVNMIHLQALSTKRSIGLHQIPKQCPHCCDMAQGKPAEKTVIRREMLREWEDVLISIPEEWFQEFRSEKRDRACRRAIVKGNVGKGAAWHGRMDIYDFRHNYEGIGHVRLMEVEHESGETQTWLKKDGSMGMTAYHAAYEYLSIDPPEGGVRNDHSAQYALCFSSVYYKTTLKGLGRQFHAGLDTDRAEWAYRLGSQARSGRFGNEMAIAIVTDRSPVFGTSTGDVEFRKIWSLSCPGGVEIQDAREVA